MTTHYLSATAVITSDGDRHLAFCGERILYPRGYPHPGVVIANYGMPNGVDCKPCIDQWRKTYPDQYARWAVTPALRNRNTKRIHLPAPDQGTMPSRVASYTLCRPDDRDYNVYNVTLEHWPDAPKCAHCTRIANKAKEN